MITSTATLNFYTIFAYKPEVCIFFLLLALEDICWKCSDIFNLRVKTSSKPFKKHSSWLGAVCP